MKPVSGHLVGCACEAAEELLAKVYRTDVTKALDPLDPDDFIRIVAQLARALETATAGQEAAALRMAIRALDLDWSKMTSAAARERIIDATRSAINPMVERVLPRITEQFEIRGGRTMAAARESAIRRFGFDIGSSLSQRDRDAEKYIRASYSNFITNAYGERMDALSSTAREIVAQGLEEGLGRDQISEALNNAFGTQVMRGASYWQVVATAFMNTARTASNLNAFAEAGIQRYRFEAVMDEATTDQCRFYHDQVFSVGDAVERMNAQMRASSLEELQATNPWVRVGTDSDGARFMYVQQGAEQTRIATIEQSGIGTQSPGTYSGAMSSAGLTAVGVPYPPLHGNCRSTIVPDGPGF